MGFRFGKDQLVSEDHSQPKSLNPLRPKSTGGVRYQKLSLSRVFSSLWHKQSVQVSVLYKPQEIQRAHTYLNEEIKGSIQRREQAVHLVKRELICKKAH